MIGGDVTAASRMHRLAVDCALADALLAGRSGEGMALLEESALPTAVFEVETGAPRLVNAAWRALFGARAPYSVIPGVDETARGRTTLHHPELALDLDGRPVYVAATLRASRDDRDTATCVIVVCVDITDEVVARELAVGADALVWSGPRDSEATYFNQRWRNHVGVTARWHDAIHPDDASRCVDALAWAVREHGSNVLEARVRGANGEFRWHRLLLALASSGTRWTGIATDIHDARCAAAERDELLARERAALADAEQTRREKDRFLAAISHELRTPLTTIVLWEAVLRDDSATPALRARALEAIHQSVLVQSRVVGDMLDISRANFGKLYVDLRPVDIESVVDEALEAITPLALEKHLALERRGAVIGDEVQGDAVRLRQVIDNLLTNAVKFTEPGGRVTVMVSRRRRAVVVEVTDTGCGIAKEFIPRIFEPFSQTDTMATRSEGGLGLGLAIARRIVDLHHGTLVASSPGLGGGATLTLTLPSTASTGATAAIDRRTPALDRTRVLVIDDDRRVRDALAVLLERAGADVDTADSAEAGRARMARRAPEAVVCDIAMPGEDGYSFISRLRASGSDVVAIALTAHVSSVDLERAIAAGFDRHLAKPIDFERLVSNIDELVAAHRAAAHAT